MNETAQIKLPKTINEARRLRKAVVELEGKFRDQRAALSRQGMSLPPGTLTGIQNIRDEIDALTAMLDVRNSELQQLRELARTTELINSTLTLDDVLNGVMDTVIGLTKAERGYLMLRDPSSGMLEFRTARNIDQRTLQADEFTISRTIVAEVAKTGTPVLTVNAGADPRFNAQESVIGLALRSILCVPLVLKGNVTGVVYADNRVKQGIFGERESLLLQLFANQAAVAIENARLFESLRASLAQITAIKNLTDNIFASIASGVITTDVTDRITQINEAACRILNVSADCLGALAWEALPLPADRLAPVVDIVRNRNLTDTLELEYPIGQRQRVTLSLKLSPLRNDARETEGVAIVVDDLTEIKQQEQQLNVVRRYLTPAMVDNIQSIDKLGLSGERRNVSVLYIDVRRFSTFPRGLAPQAMMSLLNDHLTIAGDSITQHNGIIDKYMANEVMGLFNTQLNPDDAHAWHAVQAALDALDEFRQYYGRQDDAYNVTFARIGINSGDATLGNVGSEDRREFTAIGDAINVGHRLLENAQEGEIVISGETARQCWSQLTDPANGIQIVSTETLTVKGKIQTVEALRIRRLSS
jgi:PAS domain S-box-containing protein